MASAYSNDFQLKAVPYDSVKPVIPPKSSRRLKTGRKLQKRALSRDVNDFTWAPRAAIYKEHKHESTLARDSSSTTSTRSTMPESQEHRRQCHAMDYTNSSNALWRGQSREYRKDGGFGEDETLAMTAWDRRPPSSRHSEDSAYFSADSGFGCVEESTSFTSISSSCEAFVPYYSDTVEHFPSNDESWQGDTMISQTAPFILPSWSPLGQPTNSTDLTNSNDDDDGSTLSARIEALQHYTSMLLLDDPTTVVYDMDDQAIDLQSMWKSAEQLAEQYRELLASRASLRSQMTLRGKHEDMFTDAQHDQPLVEQNHPQDTAADSTLCGVIPPEFKHLRSSSTSTTKLGPNTGTSLKQSQDFERNEYGMKVFRTPSAIPTHMAFSKKLRRKPNFVLIKETLSEEDESE